MRRQGGREGNGGAVGASGGGKLEMRKIVTTRCYFFFFFFFFSSRTTLWKRARKIFAGRISGEYRAKWRRNIFDFLRSRFPALPEEWNFVAIDGLFDGGEQHLRIIENPLGENHVSSPRICLSDSIGSLDSIRECSLMNWFDFARW